MWNAPFETIEEVAILGRGALSYPRVQLVSLAIVQDAQVESCLLKSCLLSVALGRLFYQTTIND